MKRDQINVSPYLVSSTLQSFEMKILKKRNYQYSIISNKILGNTGLPITQIYISIWICYNFETTHFSDPLQLENVNILWPWPFKRILAIALPIMGSDMHVLRPKFKFKSVFIHTDYGKKTSQIKALRQKNSQIHKNG